MKVLVFLFVISKVSLVLADADKNAIENSVTYKVHPDPDPEDVQPLNDQVAESSHSVHHGVFIGHQKGIPDGSQNHIQVPDLRHIAQNVAEQGVHVQEGLRHNPDVVQPVVNQGYSHPIYVQQYPVQPIRIFGAEAAPLQQVREGQNSLGYSSIVEHVSSKDEEEIQSALKEGSVGDIKRLVPKSGISFKIYSSEKNANLNLENQKTETQSTALHSNIPLHSRLQYETEVPAVPAAPLTVQTVEHHQPTIGLGGVHQTYVKTELPEQQHVFDTPQHLIQTVGKTDQHGTNGQTVYFAQPAIEPQKTFLEANEKVVKPNYEVNLEENTYKTLPSAELNSPSANKGYGQGFGDVGHSQYQKQWSLEGKLEGAQASKNVKPFATLQYEIDPVAQAERGKVQGLQHTQNPPTSYVVYNNYNNHKSVGEAAKNVNYLSNSYGAKPPPVHQPARVHERKVAAVINRLSGSHATGESLKVGQNHVVGHLGPNVYGGSQHFTVSQNDQYATHSYSDSEAAKTGQQNLVTPAPKSVHVETKTSQNNFDHQKALEGSTSFDIKNAIDNTGSLVHQTNYVTPEVKHLEGLQKQQLAYIIPTIPTVLIDNGIREAPILEGHQVKEFGHGGVPPPQFSYHAVSSPELSGKFFHQPRTIVWTSDHLKQGNANDVHQTVVRLNLPKEEVYKHVKVPNLDLATSSVSHVAYQQHKQPYVLHYEMPVKYPQEILFQQKTKPGLQNNQPNHAKLLQPITVDWSLFKSAMPNFNVNSLTLNPELTRVQENGKKIVPILVRKRKNRSNSKQEVSVIYGKVNTNRRPSKPNHRQEKNVRVNLLPEASNAVKQFEGNGERKNEFSVSASYKVDRSLDSGKSS